MDTYQNGHIIKRYNELFSDVQDLYAISDKLKQMKADSDIENLRILYCEEILAGIIEGFIEYGERKYINEDPRVQLYIKEVSRLKVKDNRLLMMGAFFKNDEKRLYKYFDQYVDQIRRDLGESPLNEEAFVQLLSEPLKNAFPGFWTHAKEKTVGLWENDGTNELCQLMTDVYERASDDAAADKLTAYIQKYPSIIAAREYLGLIYTNAKMWNNAIASLESVEKPNIFAPNMAEYYFTLAWCYGKIRDYKNEESYYRKCLEENEYYAFAMNNLGYCLYKQKRFVEASAILKQCVEEERDQPLSASNYVKTLIGLGRNKDAKTFIKQSKCKLPKQLIDKVKRLPATNKRLSTKAPDIPTDEPDEANIAQEPVLLVKGQQFSNEKLLEEELTHRIESGISVFGKQLKVYKRKGEYGRQYIIPIGRLDLLCEDSNGELYVIELKKDSGYSDAYKQTAKYLDWFQNSNRFKNTKVNGIICLNNPSQELINRVHEDERIRLFEYQISYTEL